MGVGDFFLATDDHTVLVVARSVMRVQLSLFKRAHEVAVIVVARFVVRVRASAMVRTGKHKLVTGERNGHLTQVRSNHHAQDCRQTSDCSDNPHAIATCLQRVPHSASNTPCHLSLPHSFCRHTVVREVDARAIT